MVKVQGKRGHDLIKAERKRQMSEERYLAPHDNKYTNAELIAAACCYLRIAHIQLMMLDSDPAELRNLILSSNFDDQTRWPWDPRFLKVTNDPRTSMIKAGALLAAEVDRYNRINE